VEEEPLFPPTDLFSEGDSLEGPGLGAPHAGAAPAARETGVDFLAGYEADAEEPEDDEGPSVFVRIGRGASWVAWPLSIALSVLAAWNLLSPQAPPPSARMVALDNGFEIHSLESRVVENALGGPLLVVSGSLRNGGNHRQALESALAVTLLGVEGQRLDEAQTLMAPTPDATALREQDPSYLRGLGDHTARRMAFHPFAPGEERPYSAVFDGIPGGATRFSVDLLRLPGPPSAPPLVGPLDEGEGLEAAERSAPVETATAFPSEVLLSRE
jgi:hypothetical protein